MSFYFSSMDMIDGEQFSEFWNRDDEVSNSEEDISDSDGEWFCKNSVHLFWYYLSSGFRLIKGRGRKF